MHIPQGCGDRDHTHLFGQAGYDRSENPYPFPFHSLKALHLVPENKQVRSRDISVGGDDIVPVEFLQDVRVVVHHFIARHLQGPVVIPKAQQYGGPVRILADGKHAHPG